MQRLHEHKDRIVGGLTVQVSAECDGVKYAATAKGDNLPKALKLAAEDLWEQVGSLLERQKAEQAAQRKGCFVEFVLKNEEFEIANKVVLQQWVAEFVGLGRGENEMRVVGLDSEGRHHRKQTWWAWLRRLPKHVPWMQLSACHGTVVFRLTDSTWDIVLPVLRLPNVTTAVFDLSAELSGLAPLSVKGISFSDTKKNSQSLVEAYSTAHASQDGQQCGPWDKESFIGESKGWQARRPFYEVFDLPIDSLPESHLRYAAADAIATRHLYHTLQRQKHHSEESC